MSNFCIKFVEPSLEFLQLAVQQIPVHPNHGNEIQDRKLSLSFAHGDVMIKGKSLISIQPTYY